MINKLLVLAGKPCGSVDIVNYAKSIGVYTIVCDYLPTDQSPAKQIADECWDYSTADTDAIIERAKQENVTAVFTGVHEFNLYQCQKICEKLNVPFYTTKTALDASLNKRIYKDIFNKCGVETIPEYKVFPDVDPDIEFPIILKPIDGSGAYGLQIVDTEKDLLEKTNKSLMCSDKKEILAEKYIQDKDEITVVYIIKDGVPYLASVADRIVKNFDKNVIPLPVAYVWNSKYLDLYQRTLDEKMKLAIKLMGIKNGMYFFQSIVKDSVIMPYDGGHRLSGTQEHVILETMCGYNPLKLLTDYAMTGIFGDDKLVSKINPRFNGWAAQITFLVYPGTIAKFVGLESVAKNPNVIRIIKNKPEGDIIPENAYGTLNQVALRVFIKAKTKDELNENIKQIRESVKVLGPDGTDLVIKIGGEQQ